MNFEKLFETQKMFDSTFVNVEKSTEIKNKFFALLVEQGEAANECPQTFKYWSTNPKPASIKTAEKYAEIYNQPAVFPKEDLLLEELVDKLHFMLSLGNELNLSSGVKSFGYITNGDLVDMQLHFTMYVVDLYFYWKNSRDDLSQLGVAVEAYNLLLGYFFGIAYELGYSETSLESAYYEKNKINYVRQENGY